MHLPKRKACIQMFLAALLFQLKAGNSSYVPQLVNKQLVVYLYGGILLSNEGERIADTLWLELKDVLKETDTKRAYSARCHLYEALEQTKLIEGWKSEG